MPSQLTQARLKELLSYDPETGLFTWKLSNSRRTKVGSIAGCIHPQGYIHIRIAGKAYGAHRLAVLYMTGSFPIEVVDHVNNKRADNRWSNLECVSNKINLGRRTHSLTNTSGHMNIWQCPVTKKWVVRVCGIYGGYHADYNYASLLADQMKKELTRA